MASLQCELNLCKEDLANCKTDLEAARRLHLDLTSYIAQAEAANEVPNPLPDDSVTSPESGKDAARSQSSSPDVTRNSPSSATRTRSVQSPQRISPKILDQSQQCSYDIRNISPHISNSRSVPSVSASLKSHLEDFRMRSRQFQAELLQTPLRSSSSQISPADDSRNNGTRPSQPS